MLLKADQQRVTALLTETVTLLCKNGLHFKSQFKIEGLIGITLDQEDIFLVNINETVAVEGPAHEDDGGTSPGPIEGRLTASKKRRQRQAAAECTQTLTSDAPLPSAKPLPATASRESFSAIHHDNSSTSDHRSRSPVQPGSVKSQSEDARPGSPRPSSSSGRAAETNASDRTVSFCDVPIKLDYALSSRDSVAGTSASEPASKRPRRHIPNPALDTASGLEQNSIEPSGFDMPSGSSSCKMEPSDIIEIKEESLSDDEMKESIAGYSSYNDYSSATAAYGNSDLDASQMYGETSGFQPDTMFQGDMQVNAGLRSHETLLCPAAPPNSSGRQRKAASAPFVECLECGKRFTGDYMVYTLRRHEATLHRGEFPHKCPVCGKGMQGIEDLRSHMVSKHKMPSDYRCEMCNEDFGKKRTLQLHMMTKHPVPS